jgi:hypothetical protein
MPNPTNPYSNTPFKTLADIWQRALDGQQTMPPYVSEESRLAWMRGKLARERKP